jgi:hypothetical protein
MAAPNLAAKSDSEIDTWIENHERRGATDTDLCRELLEQRSRRQSKILNVEIFLMHLMEAARRDAFVSYGSLAEENDVAWSKARHAMNGLAGPPITDRHYLAYHFGYAIQEVKAGKRRHGRRFIKRRRRAIQMLTPDLIA